MNIILTHPTGNANVRAACLGFIQAKLLFEFDTAIASFQGDALDQLSKLGPLSEIKRRRLDSSLQPFTYTWPWRELARLVSSKAGLSTLVKHETGFFSVDAVYQNFDRHVASRLQQSMKLGADAIYAYEDGAIRSFQEAKRFGLLCFYDLPIGYWRAARQLLADERDRWPQWASTLTGFRDSDEKLTRKDEELQLADRIFVASQFTANTLLEYPGNLAPVEVIPYGFPSVSSLEKNDRSINCSPLKLLFVGGLSQRKGIANLFAAVEYLGKHVELTVVGQKAVEDCVPLNMALIKHRWVPTLPHDKILELMRHHDVLVFPSLFEGFGLVITEAMSQGTPVITTDRTAGPDLITHNDNGWLIEAGSTDALIKAIQELLDYPQLIAHCGHSARDTARKRPWSVYGQEVARAIVSTSNV